jgi:hypothetical protein
MTESTTGWHRLVRAPVRALEDLARLADRASGVRRQDLRRGDRLIVSTRNSIYSITAAGDGLFQVAGGWFDLQGTSPVRLGINGCTAGGTAILFDLVAAPGLFLEFANRVKTTRIRRVRLIRSRDRRSS